MPRVAGLSEVKICQGKYEAYLEFPEGWGWGFKMTGKPSIGGVVNYFWNNTLDIFVGVVHVLTSWTQTVAQHSIYHIGPCSWQMTEPLALYAHPEQSV